jgi:leader peptidase (prepilin peptidase) / N-methyltransferase
MWLVLGAIAFVPGLAIGSFLNVVAARVPSGRSIVHPPSACPACAAPIAWYDNLPVLSFMWLRGRCRGCGRQIGWTYPAVELVTATLFAASFAVWGLSARAAIAAGVCAVLVAISVIDAEHRIIPNSIVLPAAVVVLVANTIRLPSVAWTLAALGGSLFLLIAALAYPAGMGMGDVKLALLIGAALGPTLPIGLLLGMLTALVPAVVLLARHGAAARKMAIPFGPFLAVGCVVTLFAGGPLLHAYLRLL